MLNLNLTIKEQQLEKLKKGTCIRIGLLRGVKKGMLLAEGYAKKSFGRPGNLHVRTGHLRRSIKNSVRKVGDGVEGKLTDNVIYAAIHEYGGMAGKGRNIRIPARPFLKPALTDNKIKISRIIMKEIMKEIK